MLFRSGDSTPLICEFEGRRATFIHGARLRVTFPEWVPVGKRRVCFTVPENKGRGEDEEMARQRRYATASALAASAIPALVMARGHVVDEVQEFPCVIDGADGIQQTKKAVACLTAIGAVGDANKARNSKKIRAGQGKMRNRRFVMRRGPLIVYSADNGISKAFRNLPGVDLCSVDRLNLLQLAPGGHVADRKSVV